jgi:hypothetical protein
MVGRIIFLSLPAFVAVGTVSALVVSGLVLVARAAARQWTNAAAALGFPILYAALSFAFFRTAYDEPGVILPTA